MAAECYNKEVLYETMKMSFSCSSPGKARWRGLSPQHCGYCVPCIIRRAAMHKAFGNDGTIYTQTSIHEMQSKNSEGIGIQLRSFQYAIDKIKKIENVLYYIFISQVHCHKMMSICKSWPIHIPEDCWK